MYRGLALAAKAKFKVKKPTAMEQHWLVYPAAAGQIAETGKEGFDSAFRLIGLLSDLTFTRHLPA